MSRTKTAAEYAIFGKMEDGLWYKVNSKEIGSHAEAKKMVSEFAESQIGTAFDEYKIMERPITITIGDWKETQ